MLNRLVARAGSGLADTAATLALLAQDAPQRVREELSLFWEEVEREAQRLENGTTAPDTTAADGTVEASGDTQGQIDALRAQVADLSRRLDS
jgi:uncharacterized protein YceH (UPF0502 family)